MPTQFTRCTIEWVDDGTTEKVIIASCTESIDEIDDHIFFYGLSPEFLLEAMQHGDIIENEWKVIGMQIIGSTFM